MPRATATRSKHSLQTNVRNGLSFGVMLHVLDWNEMAIQFYRKMDATFLDDWKTVCLKGDALRLVANTAPDI